MKSFHCDNCQHLIFFENTHCVSCGHALAYLPGIRDLVAMQPAEQAGEWKSLSAKDGDRRYRLCSNYATHGICNWAVEVAASSEHCLCCRLTRGRPDPQDDQTLDAWRRLEVAKRRLVHTLLDLGLPVRNRQEDPALGLVFDFLGDGMTEDGKPVLTGHADGVITINIAEADDVERERRRHMLHEPYRTLLGHFRHEIGHYYWDVLVKDSDRLERYREQFGDERADYAAALKHHYDNGPPVDWKSRFVSAYASTHPWEDWAETWAHYLHMIDALDTAAACGIALKPMRTDEPQLEPPGFVDAWDRPFDQLFADWISLTYVLNNLNRSLGLADGYPFVLEGPIVEKLRHVHDMLADYRNASQAQQPVDPTGIAVAQPAGVPVAGFENPVLPQAGDGPTPIPAAQEPVSACKVSEATAA